MLDLRPICRQCPPITDVVRLRSINHLLKAAGDNPPNHQHFLADPGPDFLR